MSIAQNSPGKSSPGKSFNPSTWSGTLYGSPHGRPTGPRTPQGKVIAARNPTTHGLFTRDVVLPSLGEDPQGYEDLQMELSLQLEPNGLIERHYVEKIAAASWRLRRLHRWQAQVWEDEALTEDERLGKLDRVLRHETTLQRQIDTSVRMLSRDVPLLLEGRARRAALADRSATERDCRAELGTEADVSARARDLVRCGPLSVDYDGGRVDNTNAAPCADAENCQNELPPPPAVPVPNPTPPELGAGGPQIVKTDCTRRRERTRRGQEGP